MSKINIDSINTEEFKLYPIDNLNSIKNRLAQLHNTIPKLVIICLSDDLTNFLKSSDEIYSNFNIEYIDIFNSIIKNENFYEDFNSLLESLYLVNNEKNIDPDSLLSYYDSETSFINYLYNLWLAFDEKLIKLNEELKSKDDFETAISEIQIPKNKKITDIRDFYNQFSGNIRRDFEKNVEKNNNYIKSQIKSFEDFKKISKSKNLPKISHFELKNSHYTYILDNIKNISLIDIFNQIKLNKNVVLASYKNLYKVHKNCKIPSTDWSFSSDIAIILKVYQRETPYQTIEKNQFNDAYILVDAENIKLVTNITKTSKLNITDNKKYLQRVLSVLDNYKTFNEDSKQSSFNGVFYISKQSFNKKIFADMILNNNIFKSFLIIDESTKISKKRTELIVKFIDKSGKTLTANINSKLREKNTMFSHDIGLFPIGEEYVSINILKTNDNEMVKYFMDVIPKLFKIYNNDYTNVSQFYIKYIPEFLQETESNFEKIENKKYLKFQDIAPPIVFHSGKNSISTYCNNHPRIISQDEAKKLNLSEEDGELMSFPKYKEFDMEPILLSCDHNKRQHKFPGLKPNPNPSKDTLAYVPCCFQKNQKTKTNSNFNKYENKIFEIQEKTGENFITTRKYLALNQLGSLPDSIRTILSSKDNILENIKDKQKLDSKMVSVYNRLGVVRSESSFLECILESLEIDNFNKITDSNTRLDILKDYRKNLLNPKKFNNINPNILKQELYSLKNDQIIDYIQNDKNYLDPKLFHKLLETLFDCNIFIFSSSSYNTEPSLVLPNFSKVYLNFKNRRLSKRPYIFIYEHMGSRSDNLQYPQCELIVKYMPQKLTLVSFLPSSQESKNILSVFNKLSYFESPQNKLLKHSFSLNLTNDILGNIDFISQKIDSHGKCRIINIHFLHEDQLISLITSPIPPLSIDNDTSLTINCCDINTAEKLIEKLGMKVISQNLNTDGIMRYVEEILCYFQNILVSIPIKKTLYDRDSVPVLKNVPIKINSPSSIFSYITKLDSKNSSMLENFTRNKKNARYITEYLIWLFSNYVNEKIIPESRDQFSKYDINNTLIKNFITDKISIIEDFNYGNIEKNFIKNNKSLMKNGKLILKSEETLKRLIYVLRLEITRNIDKIFNYHSFSNLENYYSDVSDLDKHNNIQTLLFTEKAILKLILHQNSKNYSNNTYYSSKIIPDALIEPYYFKNDLVSKTQVFLAQHTTSLQHAITISENWLNNNKNIGPDISSHKYNNKVYSSSGILYSYVNKDNMTKYLIPSENNTNITKIKIVGYKLKIGNQTLNRFVALLPFN